MIVKHLKSISTLLFAQQLVQANHEESISASHHFLFRGTQQWLLVPLTHWGQKTHICVGKLTIIASDNGLSPGRRQAIIWTNAGMWLIGSLETNFNEILIGIQTFSFKKTQLKMLSVKWRPFCLGLNVLTKSQKVFLSHNIIMYPYTSTNVSWQPPYSKLTTTRSGNWTWHHANYWVGKV